MTRDPDFIDLIERYLDDFEGHTPLPDAARDAIRARTPSIPQRPAWWPGWRFPEMNTVMKYALGAAAALVAVIVGIAALGGIGSSNIGGPSATHAPGSSSPAFIDGQSKAVDDGALAAGRYHIDVALQGYLNSFTVQPGGEEPIGAGGRPFAIGWARVSFDLPEGWLGDGSAVVKANAGSPVLAMTPMTVDRVNRDPCHPSNGDFVDPPLMRTADGVAEALSRWWAYPTSPDSTGATAKIMAGLDGWYVEVLTPIDLDISACESGEYLLWSDASGRPHYAQDSGQLDRLWILDGGIAKPRLERDGTSSGVAGGVLVIDAASQRQATARDLAELQAVIDSIEIEVLEAP